MLDVDLSGTRKLVYRALLIKFRPLLMDKTIDVLNVRNEL